MITLKHLNNPLPPQIYKGSSNTHYMLQRKKKLTKILEYSERTRDYYKNVEQYITTGPLQYII